MDRNEKIAKALLELAHERINVGREYPRPFIQPLGSIPTIGSAGMPSGCFERTFYRRRLMDILGIPVTRRWLRRQR